jgi:hypothetical protein
LGHSGALHRYVASTQQFDSVSADAAEIGQYVRSQIGVPARAVLEGVFTFTLNQLPTHRPRPKSAAPAAPPKPQLASAVPVEAAKDVAAVRAKIQELEKELQLSGEVDRLQSKLDEAASRVFELESQLKANDVLKEQLAEAQTSMAATPTPESLGLPPDIREKVERYPQMVAKRDEALAKLEEDSDESAPTYVEPLTRDWRFWVSMVAGFGFLVAGALTSGATRYLALLDIPAFGVAAILALRYLDTRERAERGQRKGSRRAEREQKIQEQFEAEAGIVRTAMKALKVDTPNEVNEALNQRAVLGERVVALQQQLEQAEKAPEFQTAQAELGKAKEKQQAIESELSARGSYIRDAREVEREIARAKESLALGEEGAPAPAVPVPAPAAPPAALADPMPALLSLGADLFALDLPSTATLLKDRATAYVSAFTDRRVTGVEMDVLGKTVVTTAQGKLPANELAGSDLNLLYLAVRFAIIEKYSAKFRVPVVLEDVMAGLDPQRLALMARALKTLGKLTQVLHVTDRTEFAEVADGQLSV